MSKCSLCGRNISSKTAHFGLGCLRNTCTIIGIEKVKNLKGETILNNRIAKLSNKKMLNKNDKTILTNRYLTLELLNRIPINSYNRIRRSVQKDIEKVGLSNNIKGDNNLITLKQAYQAFKLYNKFQKIKNKAEEVDSEDIQNFLFDNLSFAFSTYYKNKKYLNGIILEIQRYFWKMIVMVFKEKYPLGTEFINYSLQENPKDRVITQGRIIGDIIDDSRFKEKINQIIEDNDNKRHFDVTAGLNYASMDLFLALNNTTINVIGNKEESKWKLDITITDRYDFTDFKEIDEYCNENIKTGLIGSTANNMAMISVESGVMHEYNITIKFTIDRWEQ